MKRLLLEIPIKLIFTILILFAVCLSCNKNDDSPTSNTNNDPNGQWTVTLSGGHCTIAKRIQTFTVTGGNFDFTMTYTETSTTPQWTSTTRFVGTITKGNVKFVVDGNESITGGCANGTNGFFGYIDPSISPIEGDVSSNFGTIHWKKN